MQSIRGASNPPQGIGSSHEPAVINTSAFVPSNTKSGPPPAYSQSAAQNITADELQKRQEELERKAAELAAREEALRNAPYAMKENNWPPLPKMCPLNPCFYQDINVEIPVEFQKIVRLVYYLWMCRSFVILFLISNDFMYSFKLFQMKIMSESYLLIYWADSRPGLKA